MNYTFRILVFSILICLFVSSGLVSQDAELGPPGADFQSSSESAATNPISTIPRKPAQISSKKISLNVKDMNVVDVLKILSEEGKFNISISGNVRGRVTLFLKDIDVWEALEIVIASAGLAYERTGNVINVVAEREYELQYGKKYWDKRTVEIFNFRNAQVLKVREVFTQMVSKIGKVIVDASTNTVIVIDVDENVAQMREVAKLLDKNIETKVFQLNYLQAADLEEKLTQVLTKEAGTLKIDEASNKIIVTDYPEKITEIEAIVWAFDERPPQVIIDAKIIEIKPNQEFYAGVDLGYWIEKYFGVEGQFSFPSTSSDKVSFGTIGVEDVSARNDYKGVIELLETIGETNILSSPRIMVLNNQEAKIMVGTKDVYITSSVSEVGESAVTTQSLNFVDVGMKLFVTPTINKQGYITMKIRPEISESQRESITSEDKITEVPIVSTSEAETTVMVRDGVTIIIGGLKKIKSEKEKKQVPFLGNIPFLGTFFRSTSDTWEKSDLVILLTPYIVSPDIDSPEMQDIDKLSPLFEKGKEKVDIYKEKQSQEPKEKPLSKAAQKKRAPLKPEIPDETEKLQALLDELLAKEERREERDYAAIEKVVPAMQRQPAITREERTISEGTISDYYRDVFRKIQSVSSVMGSRRKGEIRVFFTLTSSGRLLHEPEIIYSSDRSLEDIARKIVRQSSPFSPFPPTLRQPSQDFEILISLE